MPKGECSENPRAKCVFRKKEALEIYLDAGNVAAKNLEKITLCANPLWFKSIRTLFSFILFSILFLMNSRNSDNPFFQHFF